MSYIFWPVFYKNLPMQWDDCMCVRTSNDCAILLPVKNWRCLVQ